MATEASANATSPASLWSNRDFLLLTAGEAVSAMGTAVAAFALPLVVFGLTGSPFLASVVATAGILGSLCSSLVVGGWVDRHSRRHALLTGLGIRTVAWLALAVLVMLSWANIALWVALAFIGGGAAALYRAAEAGALKSIVSREQFPTAVAVSEARSAVASLAGGPLGAVMLGVAVALPFWLNSMSFLVSVVGVAAIKAELGRPNTPAGYPFLDSIRDGFRFMWRQRAFRWILLGSGVSNLGRNGFNFALVLILRQAGEPLWVIGLLETSVGLSILGGSFVAPWLVRRVNVGWLVIVSTASAALVLGATALRYDNVAAVLVLTATAYLLAPASNSATMSYLAVVTPPEYQGRVASTDEFVSGALLPLATITGGLLLSSLRASATLAILAATVLLAALVLVGSRSVRQFPRLSRVEEATVPGR